MNGLYIKCFVRIICGTVMNIEELLSHGIRAVDSRLRC